MDDIMLAIKGPDLVTDGKYQYVYPIMFCYLYYTTLDQIYRLSGPT